MNISDLVWATPLAGGETLETRVSRKPPTVRPIDLLDKATFITIWRQRLKDAVVAGDKDQEQKARSLLEFIEAHQSHEFVLLQWSELKLLAIYNVTLTKVFVIE
jgi:hypothetical protein